MEKFYFEEPSIERKEDAIEYINEHINFNSRINGSCGLDKYIDDYESWLLKLEEIKADLVSDTLVPKETFFLIRKSDNKIIGMINIRLLLNDFYIKGPGNIGYGIRPTERMKGYNKINLYLGLLELQRHNVKEALLDCLKSNIASSKTMLALGAVKYREFIQDGNEIECYKIDVNESILKYKDKYEPLIDKNIKKKAGLRLTKLNYADAKEEYEALINIPEENGFENKFKDLNYEDFYKEIENSINESKGINLKEGYVPQTIYFLWDNNKIVGMFKLRHYLNEKLKNGAGHIGYGIRKDCMNKGYATLGLKLLIEEAKKIINDDELYFSVHKDNKASLRVQEKNGAYIFSEDDKEFYTRIKIK